MLHCVFNGSTCSTSDIIVDRRSFHLMAPLNNRPRVNKEVIIYHDYSELLYHMSRSCSCMMIRCMSRENRPVLGSK